MRLRPTVHTLVTLVTSLSLLLAACGGDGADETTTPTTAPSAVTTTAADGDAAPTTTASTVPDEDQTTTTTIAAIDPFLADAPEIAALAGVDSYRVRMEMRLTGTVAMEEAGFEGFLMESAYVADPPAEQISVSIGADALFEQITIGENAWLRMSGDDTWMPMEAATTPLQGITGALYEPDLTGVSEGWRQVGSETINGRDTIHYEADLADQLVSGLLATDDAPDLTTFDLDVWADPAGFIVKMEMVMEGAGFDAADPGGIGRIDYQYEVYDFGADIVIAPPV